MSITPVAKDSLKTRGLRFGAVGTPTVPAVAPTPPVSTVAAVATPVAPPRKTTRNDPRLIAAARELRDRWLEQVNGPDASPLIGCEKYAVSRAVGQGVTIEGAPTKLLAA